MNFFNKSIEGGGGGRLLLLAVAVAGAVIAGLALPTSVGAQLYERSDESIQFSFAVGGAHACAIDASGALSCWGLNDRGQASVPPGRFNEVLAGDDYTCADKTAGPIICFGSVSSSWDSWEDLHAVHARPWRVGRDHSCTLSSSWISCTGLNVYGQSENPRNALDFRANASDFRAGRDHNCAINNSGGVWCWGRNSNGQATVPEGRYREIATGRAHTCAITDTERLRCWGESIASKPGDASSSGSPWSHIWSNSNARFTCAANEDRKLYCWGDNRNGQLNVPAKFSLDGTGPTESDPPAAETPTAPRTTSSTRTTTSVSSRSSSISSGAEGRIVARIVNRDPENRETNCDYQIEFGLLPGWAALPGGNPTNASIDNNAVLPRSRYLTCAQILKREARTDQRWLPSTLIEVPIAAPEPADTGGFAGGDDDDATVTGYVIVRYVLWRGASLRIEFGFIHSRHFAGGVGELQRAAELHAVLPDRRYITRAMIASGSTRWLVSPPISLAGDGTGTTLISMSAPVLSSLYRGQTVDSRVVGQVIGPVADGEFGVVRTENLPAQLSVDLGEAVRNDGRETRSLVLSGTVAQATAERSYSVKIFVRTPDGSEIPGDLTIPVERGRVPRTSWDNHYGEDMISEGESINPLPPIVLAGPVNPNWSYRSTTAEICDVASATGRLTGKVAGQCEIVATLAPKDGWGPATETAEVRILGLVPPTIRWEGYEPPRMPVGGDSPRLLRPSAADPRTGRTVPLDYSYEQDDSSDRVCQVDPRSGRITALQEGICRVTVTSAPTQSLREGSRMRQVTITPKTPPVSCELNYDENIKVDGRANADYHCPGGGTRTFRTETPAICSVNYNSGEVTGDTAGLCEIIADVRETRTHAATSVTAFLIITTREEPPEVLSIDCEPSSPEIEQDVTCTPRLDGDAPDTYSWSGGVSDNRGNRTYVTRFDTDGTKTISLTVRNSEGSDSDSIRLTVTKKPPEILSISCSPQTANVEDRITCTPRLSGGEPDTYSWSGGDSDNRDNRTYATSFGTSGTKTISLTVRNSAGEDSDSTNVTIESGPESPICDNNPHEVNINEDDEEPFPSEGYCFDPDGDDDRLRITATSGDSDIAHAEEDRRQGWIFVGNGHGTATITVTATDPDGLSASAYVTVNVRGTVRCGDISSVFGTVNGSRRQIDLNDYCRHPVARRSVTYSNARSDNARYASVSLNGSTLTITPGSAVGAANITFTATGSGLNTRTFTDWFEAITNPRNRGGSGSGSGGDSGNGGTQAPRVSVSCPSPANLGQTVTCTANVSRGAPVTYSWSGGSSSGSDQRYRVNFRSPGVNTISLTVRNSAGSDSDSDTIRVETPPIPPSGEDLARCGSDRQSVYFFNQSRWSKHHLNMTWEQAVATWAGRGKAWSESIIDRLSQSQCDKWPTGADYTYSNNPW